MVKWVTICFAIFILYSGSALAFVCEGNYTVNDSGDIAALSGCTEITGYLSIKSNTLTNLTGLENLTSVGEALYISTNPALTSLTGLGNLTQVRGLVISTNPVLTSLTGLENLTSVEEVIIRNNALMSLTGLENLTSVGGALEVSNNSALTSLTLLNLTSVGGCLVIEANPVLTSLTGLENLTSVGGCLFIWTNVSLTSLTGLNNLASVGNLFQEGGALWIEGSSVLTSLTGLNNLTSVNGDLIFRYNDVLTSLCALYQVNLGENNVSIHDNTALSMDTAYALETQLRNNGFTGIATIYNNNGTGQVFCDNCPDGDGDGVCDDVDNCPATWQWNQKDSDGDGIGDWCDDCQDKDDDGVCADVDNCPCVSNPLQLDADKNNIGDACDPDTDNDGVLDDDDLCPQIDATGQDYNGDGCIDIFN